jgi:hypothetical protein
MVNKICIKTIRRIVVFFVVFLLPGLVKAQNDTIHYDVSVFGLYSTGVHSPFWLDNRQYGINSTDPQSAGMLVGIQKDMLRKSSLFDYGFKANLLLHTDKEDDNVYFHELYAKLRFSVLDFIVGSREEHLGNQDSTLSSGGILFSQNSRPMPKITIGIENFTPVPFTKGYVEVKGALTHGWFDNNSNATGVFLHHKYAYLKIGGRLPVHFQYGLDHVAQWGGVVKKYGIQPTSLKDYFSIFMGDPGGSDAYSFEQINALGNHIISQSLRLDINLFDISIGGYWQNISEDAPVRFIGNNNNAADGLWGISIKSTRFPIIKGFVYEYLNTTDQSGPYHDKDGVIYGGQDDYFFNYLYVSGWTYFTRTIGTPFITIPSKINTVYNNRVQLHHFGVEGNSNGYYYRILCSLSKNYGSYDVPFPVMIRNTSCYFEINKKFPRLRDVEVGCSMGVDVGKLYGNSYGFMLKLRKKGNLINY